ncbi:MAG: hypothetical protein ACTSU5_01935, partial [Promethearchaeota archaeon]
MTGDGVNDIFFWLNPQSYDQAEYNKQPNATTQVVVVNGKTGKVETRRNLADHPWYLPEETLMFRTKDNDVIVAASIGNLTREGTPDDPDYYHPNFKENYEQNHLLRFSIDLSRPVDPIKLEQTANFTSQGWQSSYLSYESTKDQKPFVRYLRNLSIPAPGIGAIPSTDLIVVQNQFNWSATNGNRTLSFIDPQTFLTIT